MRLKHIEWINIEEDIETNDKSIIKIYEFKYDVKDQQIMNEWAKHFRENYCSDEEFDDLVDGTGMTKSEYLIKIKFPDERKAPGPSIRAGDFAELLVADYIEFTMGYYIPRTRYDRKTIKDESTKGSDLLAFKIVNETFSNQDILLVDEVKAAFSTSSEKERLQTAVDHSKKDLTRLAESLNAIKQRLREQGKRDKMQIIKRFQNKVDNPFILNYGASAIIDNKCYDKNIIQHTSIQEHPDKNIMLIVIRGDDLMKLTHELYRRASLC